MGLRANPTQRQRRLGIELRRLRLSAGLSVGEAAAAAGLGPPHLGHIEAARTAIPEVKLRALTDAYGCGSEPLVDALATMSRATGRGWWSDYKRHMDAQALDLAELESTSVSCRSFQWLYVPGLLQTPEYVRALIESGGPNTDPTLRDKYIEFRLRRQHAVLSGTLRFHAVIHETALRMQFVPPDVMRDQIEHLVRMARLPHVRIQLLPFKNDVRPPIFSTPFLVFEAAVPELGTVYVEQPVTSPFLNEQQHLGGFAELFDDLQKLALPTIAPRSECEFPSRRDSLSLIQHLLYTL
ncbi:helix-turn-helix transcriptional regulator [Streptomyces sp. I05A-00742]|uniref:helix-turn-helix domain-containing protein n=1 Tax=Streptomyces sp. I05A-00742 TaxID=2732853 RepID=UPI001487F4E3|nr:helix-turn-helix transcriptional regulator [Streptomyces sp. I05A-00742]